MKSLKPLGKEMDVKILLSIKDTPKSVIEISKEWEMPKQYPHYELQTMTILGLIEKGKFEGEKIKYRMNKGFPFYNQYMYTLERIEQLRRTKGLDF